MDKKKLRIAISHGDYNGIGYEVILKTLAEERILELFTPVLFASERIASYWKEKLGIEMPSWHKISSTAEIKDHVINLVDCDREEVDILPGQPTRQAGLMAYHALHEATQAVLSGICHALVTAPINKAIMPRDLFPFPGHTQYLEHMAGQAGEQGSLMLLTARECRVALITDHIPIARVSSSLSQEIITTKVKLLDAALRRDYGVIRPRIAVLGLNPHAGDLGLLGGEEQSIISPAIATLQNEGYLVFGPYPSDSFWTNGRMDGFDAIVAMYHDQGLAPFKALYMDEGVNVTLGLSIVRTSPDHGTGYDIAGQGIADPNSLRHAIYEAIDIYRHRIRYDEATRHPLPRIYNPRGRDDDRVDMGYKHDDSY